MANTIDLNGRNAVVTGGAQGIGRAIVERLLDSGARSRSGTATASRRMRPPRAPRNRRVEAVAVDVTDLAGIEAARDATVKALGRIDILVNNAGIAGPNLKTWEYPLQDWAQVMRVNLDSQFFCCRAIVPLMIAQNYGRIVNIASIAARKAIRTRPPIRRRRPASSRSPNRSARSWRATTSRSIASRPPRPGPRSSTR
jgi:3-oxoacyl-[acyl-carrier protein] reductase